MWISLKPNNGLFFKETCAIKFGYIKLIYYLFYFKIMKNKVYYLTSIYNFKILNILSYFNNIIQKINFMKNCLWLIYWLIYKYLD